MLTLVPGIKVIWSQRPCAQVLYTSHLHDESAFMSELHLFKELALGRFRAVTFAQGLLVYSLEQTYKTCLFCFLCRRNITENMHLRSVQWGCSNFERFIKRAGVYKQSTRPFMKSPNLAKVPNRKSIDIFLAGSPIAFTLTPSPLTERSRCPWMLVPTQIIDGTRSFGLLEGTSRTTLAWRTSLPYSVAQVTLVMSRVGMSHMSHSSCQELACRTCRTCRTHYGPSLHQLFVKTARIVLATSCSQWRVKKSFWSRALRSPSTINFFTNVCRNLVKSMSVASFGSGNSWRV